jgi:hypothetical protein
MIISHVMLRYQEQEQKLELANYFDSDTMGLTFKTLTFAILSVESGMMAQNEIWLLA